MNVSKAMVMWNIEPGVSKAIDAKKEIVAFGASLQENIGAENLTAI
jgi:hypothetical protein